MGANTEIDDGLTDEERAALESDDDLVESDGSQSQNAGDDGEAAGDEGKGDGADDAGTGADDGAAGGDDAAGAGEGGDDGSAADAAAAAEQPAVPPAESAPILVVQPPAEAEAKLQDISTQKADLLEKFDDGDITAREYQTQLEALNKQELDLQLDLREAKLAEKLEAQRQQNEWNATVNGFIAENTQYNPESNPTLYQMLDIEVRRVALTDEFKNRTDMAAGKAILQKAHENIAKATGMQIKPKGKTAQQQKPDAPPSLHNVPAADLNDTKGGKYAVLDRLSTSDPIAYEEALMKLPEAERDAYMNS